MFLSEMTRPVAIWLRSALVIAACLAAGAVVADPLHVEAFALKAPEDFRSQMPQFRFWKELSSARSHSVALVGSGKISGLTVHENPKTFPNLSNDMILFDANARLIAAVSGYLLSEPPAGELTAELPGAGRAIKIDAEIFLRTGKRIEMPFEIKGEDWRAFRYVFRAAVPYAMACWGIENAENLDIVGKLLKHATDALNDFKTHSLDAHEREVAEQLSRDIDQAWARVQARLEDSLGGDPLASWSSQ